MSDPARLADAVGALAGVAVGAASTEPHRHALTVPISGGTAVLVDALRRLDAAGIAVDDVGVRRPTLDDVFLALTGRPAEERADDEREEEAS